MTGSTKLNYALFCSTEAASAAQARFADAPDAEVELVTNAADFTQDKIPLRHTMAASGTIFGALMVAGLMVAVLGGLILLGVDPPLGLSSPYETTAIVVLLGALFGGLAGALSYSTRAREELRRLRNLLRFGGNSLLLIESERDSNPLQRCRGAIHTGTLR